MFRRDCRKHLGLGNKMFINDCIAWIAVVTVYVSGQTDICDDETFDAECDTDHVIVVTRAIYGRMKMNRCITTNYGNIGCQTDVLHLLDEWCSGKTECSFPVARRELKKADPCRGLWGYLEISYSCVLIANTQVSTCNALEHQNVPQGGLYISNSQIGSNCGSSSSPWTISAQPGQNIKLSLLDFARSGASVGYITENTIRQDILNSANERESMVYMSSESNVDITFTTSETIDKLQFLLKIEAFGCPDLSPPASAYYHRSDNAATYGCTYSKRSWAIKCVGNIWMGVIGNCSSDVDDDGSLSTEDYGTSYKLPKSLLVALIVGGVLIVCSILLVCGLLCYFKQHTQRNKNTKPPNMYNTTYTSEQYQYPGAECVEYAHPDVEYREYGNTQCRTMSRGSQGNLMDIPHKPGCTATMSR